MKVDVYKCGILILIFYEINLPLWCNVLLPTGTKMSNSLIQGARFSNHYTVESK